MICATCARLASAVASPRRTGPAGVPDTMNVGLSIVDGTVYEKASITCSPGALYAGAMLVRAVLPVPTSPS